MIYIGHRICPICNNNNVETLHTQHFVLPDGHPLTKGYDVVACIKCGFVFADTVVSQSEYDRFYAQFSKYEDVKTGTGGGEKLWDRKRLEETAHQIADFLQDSEARILDIGCANGGMLKALKDHGYKNLCGIDPSLACVENTRRLGIEAYQGSLFQPFQGVGEFDCVILSHTLEHVQELSRATGFVKSVLRKDKKAILYTEVPDAASYKDFVFAPFQDFNTEHINHFSLISLSNLMRMNEFAVVESGSKIIESSPNMPYPAIFTFARYMPTKYENAVVDTLLINSIKTYINYSQRMMNDMEAQIQKMLSQYNQIIVWGTGQLTLKLLAETTLAKASIVAFVDSNPINQGKILHGVKVIAPEKVIKFSEPILISSTLHQNSIVEQIKQMNISNPLVLFSGLI